MSFILMILVLMPEPDGDPRLSQLVDPRIGTGGHGHTYPGASAPFGMVQLSPDTRIEGWDACSGYHYSDTTILGFSHTHLSGTGIPDYGDILFTPMSGAPDFTAGLHRYYPSRFRHDDERAHAGYYSVMLEDHRVLAELTATTRVGVHRYTCADDSSLTLLVDLLHGLGPDKVIDSQIEVIGPREISGSRRSSGWAKDQQIFFHAVFSTAFSGVELFREDRPVPRETSVRGTNVKCVLRFSGRASYTLVAKVGLSFVSPENARINLEAEAPRGETGSGELRLHRGG